MLRDDVTVLLVGIDDALGEELDAEDGFVVSRASELSAEGDAADAVVVALDGTPPIEMVGRVRATMPEAAVIVITDPDRAADGSIALHAGAEDHLIAGAIPEGLLPRAVRYAVAHRRLFRELSAKDAATGLLSLRGFAPIAEHHIHMADRTTSLVVFLFVRLDDFLGVREAGRVEDADSMARETAEVLLQAVRDSDVPARISLDTFCVLLTGDATGAETLVLSRLVDAIAEHDGARDDPQHLAISVGSALYDPEHPDTLEAIMETAARRLAPKGSA